VGLRGWWIVRTVRIAIHGQVAAEVEALIVQMRADHRRRDLRRLA
jgi:hypothetical protein